jgi:hypothetical protein
MMLNYLRYHEDFREIIRVVSPLSFKKTLEVEIFNNVIRLPGLKEGKG